MTHTSHPAFKWLRSKTIDSLNITISEYQHHKTGAQHIHISADNSENVFLVALRTVPTDSTGVAHILEHTALCGSERYPVRDPFFMMIRRSLNTFMNAMTSSDWTAYPFASQNKKDFDNLLGVYLDAVFFSRLDPLDFAQEGHRLDFKEPGNTDSPLVYKGVVYNEMKGAMSSVSSQLWQVLNKYLYPTSTYHYNSGGEPSEIPKLSYQALKDFYTTHYHPSNASFMTFGDISAEEHQEKFEELALKRFNKLDKTISVAPEKRYSQPIKVSEPYAYTPTSGEDKNKQSHTVIAWLLDKSIDLKSNLEAHLLSSLLFDNSASPLQHLLETSDLGTSPSPLCGMEDSQYEMIFMCGLQGCASDAIDQLEQDITALLTQLVEDGIAQTHIEASLHQLELQQREIGGDSYPYGLQLLMSALSPATHRGDIISFMDLETALQTLRESIKDRQYIPQLIKRLLVDNPHRVSLTLYPDENLQAQQQCNEEDELEKIKTNMLEAEKQQLVTQASALEKRQQEQENIEILPKVGIEDIPSASTFPNNKKIYTQQQRLTQYTAGTNGLCYQQVVFTIPDLTPEETQALPYYTLCLTELGIGEDDYLNVQQRQAKVVGSIQAYYSLRNHINHPSQYHASLTLSAKALSDNQQAMSELMVDTLLKVNFDDIDRIKELVSQAKANKEQSITGNGHSYAMQAAAAPLNPIAAINQKLSGLDSIRSIKACFQQLQDNDGEQLISVLKSIHQQLLTAKKQHLLITEEQWLEQQSNTIINSFSALPAYEDQANLYLPIPDNKTIKQAWITPSQVHFCAKVYPTVTMNHPDAPVLSVLGGVLRNGFLHRTIREQGGAYGGGASQDNHSASFRFYSYRDPRMSETLQDFDDSVTWLLEKNLTESQIEESILNIISAIDKPSSPAGEAKQAFYAELTGRNNTVKNQFRQGVIDTRADDLYRVAQTYLVPEKANIAVVTGQHGQDEAHQLALDIIHL